jgi:hypothetical protein
MYMESLFIFIYHTTKKGKHEHAHEVDEIIQAEKGKMNSMFRLNADRVMGIEC